MKRWDTAEQVMLEECTRGAETIMILDEQMPEAKKQQLLSLGMGTLGSAFRAQPALKQLLQMTAEGNESVQ